MSEASIAAAVPGTRFRWVIVGLMLSVFFLNYVDRTAISFAIPQIRSEFGLNDLAAGLILGGFGAGYFVGTLVGGALVDRLGARPVLLVAALFWSAAIGGTGLATGAVTLFIARVTLGVAEAPNFSAMGRAIGSWLPIEERSAALATALISVPAALALSGPLITFLIVPLGWRLTFAVLAVLVLLWTPFWIWLYRDDPARSSHVNAAERARIGTPARLTVSRSWRAEWRVLLTNRTLLANTWGFFVFGYFLFFFMGWLPDYLERVYHLSLRSVGLFSFLPWAGGAVAIWWFGRLSDRILRRTGRLRLARTRLIMLTQLGSACAVVPVIFADNVTLAIVLISLAVSLCMAANPAYLAVGLDVAPAEAGLAFGMMDAAFAVSAFIAPSITGFIVSVTGGFGAAFGLMAALAASSVVVMFLFHHPDTDREPAGS